MKALKLLRVSDLITKRLLNYLFNPFESALHAIQRAQSDVLLLEGFKVAKGQRLNH